MTTIAYKLGVIAFDSRRTRDGYMIISDNEDKSVAITKNDMPCTAVSCGSIPDINELLMIYSGEIDPSKSTGRSLQAEAFVLIHRAKDKDESVVHIGFSGGELWEQAPCEDGDAIGSGSKFAFTAFDFGATAEEAVSAASKRDPFTGGKIRTIGRLR